MGIRLPDSRLGRAIVWLLVAIFVAFVFGWLPGRNDLLTAQHLRESGIHAQGVVTSITPGNSSSDPTAYYTFQVDGRTVYGHSRISAADVGKLGPAASVKVTYLPGDNDTSCLSIQGLEGSAKRTILASGVVELVLAAIFIPLVIYGSPSARQKAPMTGNIAAATAMFCVMGIAGIGALFFGVLPNYQQCQKLASEGKTVTAQLTAVADSGHGRSSMYAKYTYSVDGIYYHGKAPYNGGYQDQGPISITYLPSDPTFSAIDPQKKLADARMGIPLTVLLVGLLGLLLAGFRYDMWRRGYLRRQPVRESF